MVTRHNGGSDSARPEYRHVEPPVFAGQWNWTDANGQAQPQVTLFSEGAGHFWLLASSGIITAVPLLLFGSAAARLPLSTVGMIQYVAPIGQFILAIAVLGESMPLERWIGFGIVWCAVLLMILDAVRAPRARRLQRKRNTA